MVVGIFDRALIAVVIDPMFAPNSVAALLNRLADPLRAPIEEDRILIEELRVFAPSEKELAEKTGKDKKPVVKKRSIDAFNTRVLGEIEEDEDLSVVEQAAAKMKTQAEIETQIIANQKSGGKNVTKGSTVVKRMTDDERGSIRAMTGVTSQYKSAYSYFRTKLGEYNYRHILEGRRQAYDDRVAAMRLSEGGLIEELRVFAPSEKELKSIDPIFSE